MIEINTRILLSMIHSTILGMNELPQFAIFFGVLRLGFLGSIFELIVKIDIFELLSFEFIFIEEKWMENKLNF